MKNPIKLLLAQDGTAFTHLVYTGLYNNDKTGHECIYIYSDLVKTQTGVPTTATENTPMRVDNTTLVPIIDQQGQPVTEMVQQQSGTDEQGQPIYQDVAIQKYIGEYDKVVWEHFDKENPNTKPIELAILEGFQRKLTGDMSSLVFVQTQDWLDSL